MSTLRLLLLEDDQLFAETLIDYLESQGYVIDHRMDGEEALEASYQNRYDLFLLDVKTPLLSGFEFLKLLRESGDQTPAIFITSADDKLSLLKGFALGCDDYLGKPFDLEELAVRINAIFQRIQNAALGYTIASARFDPLARKLYVDEQTHRLKPQESELLILLCENQGRVVRQQEIYEHIWEGEPNPGSLRVYVRRLRQLLGSRTIVNLHGEGYLLNAKGY